MKRREIENIKTPTLKIIAFSDTHGVDSNFAKLYTAVKDEIESDKASD